MDNLKAQFENDGYAICENLFTNEECDEMIAAIRKEIAQRPSSEKRNVFSAESSEDHMFQNKERYFIDSANKIRFFYEENGVDDEGHLKVGEEHLSMAKIGHALHRFNPVFRKYTTDKRVKQICSKLGLIDPVVVQSMYIFKNTEIGSEIKPHQDGSYLRNIPLNIVGIWIALEDATLENGCLWFDKGSHKGDLDRLYIRNPDENSEMLVTYTSPLPNYDLNKFIPVPAKRGTCVAIHGKVVHYSKPNKSKSSRNIYTFHVAEQKDSVWSKENWLQMPESEEFFSIHE